MEKMLRKLALRLLSAFRHDCTSCVALADLRTTVSDDASVYDNTRRDEVYSRRKNVFMKPEV